MEQFYESQNPARKWREWLSMLFLAEIVMSSIALMVFVFSPSHISLSSADTFLNFGGGSSSTSAVMSMIIFLCHLTHAFTWNFVFGASSQTYNARYLSSCCGLYLMVFVIDLVLFVLRLKYDFNPSSSMSTASAAQEYLEIITDGCLFIIDFLISVCILIIADRTKAFTYHVKNGLEKRAKSELELKKYNKKPLELLKARRMIGILGRFDIQLFLLNVVIYCLGLFPPGVFQYTLLVQFTHLFLWTFTTAIQRDMMDGAYINFYIFQVLFVCFSELAIAIYRSIIISQICSYLPEDADPWDCDVMRVSAIIITSVGFGFLTISTISIYYSYVLQSELDKEFKRKRLLAIDLKNRDSLARPVKKVFVPVSEQDADDEAVEMADTDLTVPENSNDEKTIS